MAEFKNSKFIYYILNDYIAIVSYVDTSSVSDSVHCVVDVGSNGSKLGGFFSLDLSGRYLLIGLLCYCVLFSGSSCVWPGSQL